MTGFIFTVVCAKTFHMKHGLDQHNKVPLKFYVAMSLSLLFPFGKSSPFVFVQIGVVSGHSDGSFVCDRFLF